jgi:arylsulfatase A-like enzyme
MTQKSHKKPACRKAFTTKAVCSVLTSLILAAGFLSCAKDSGGPASPNHVVFISMDTARADHFGFMGNSTVHTPNLDAIAGEAIVFTDYMTVVPTTLASHVSLFTGKYPHNHGVPRNGYMVNRANKMLAEILKDAGYHTVGFAAAFALHSRFDFAQGFGHYDEDFTIGAGHDGAWQDQRRAEEVTDAVIGYLDHTGIPDNLFLFVHYFDPHTPYTAPPPFDTIYDDMGRRDLPGVDFFRARQGDDSPRVVHLERRKESQYAAEITYMDHHLGRLLRYLEVRGILDDALLVVTSDHGESLWEHNEIFNHGFRVYQSTIHAVCMIRLPAGRAGGIRVDQITANIDVLPTVLAYLGMDVPSDIDGVPLNLTTIHEHAAPRIRFSEASKPWKQIETDPRWFNMTKARCVHDGPFKLIQVPYQGLEELYNVELDPDELDNLLQHPSPETAELVDSLRQDLEVWAASADPLPSQFEPTQTQDTVRRLRSLGYL